MKLQFFVMLLLCLSGKAFTQIVNMESQRYRTDTIGWSGSISGDFSINDYGEKVIAVNASAHLQYKSLKSLYLLLGSYGFLKGDERSFIDYGFLHFRYNYKLSKLLRLEAFTQVQQNAVTKIDSRFLLGAGPRFKIADKEKIHLYAASLVMYEVEKESSSQNKIKNIRSSNYLSLTYVPNAQAELITTTYYQPVLFDGSDYRLLNQTTYKIKASTKLAITINWNYQFDSMPAVGVQKHTYGFSTGLELGL